MNARGTAAIGVDFDNTIVSYDGLFHRMALERGIIPADLPPSKTRVRDHLRATGREDLWTEMQGLAYGTCMHRAEPFPGAAEFFAACARHGTRAHIISHRTRTPFLGPACDLHEAAIRWLEQQGFFSPPVSLPRENVFFELTREAKFDRISRQSCAIFIDDLPEFLSDPSFPPGIRRILFDPLRIHGEEPHITRFEAWPDIRKHLLP